MNEIDQELRQERMRQMWRQYGVYIIAGVVAIVLFVAGRQGLVAYQESARNTAADAYHTALLDAGDERYPVLLLVMAKATPCWRGFSWLPMLQIAVTRLPPRRAYLALAADESLGLVYRDAALILSVMNAADGTTADELDRRLDPVASNQGGWAMMAMELQIGVALKAGNIQRARELALNMRENLELPADANRRLQLIEAAIGE